MQVLDAAIDYRISRGRRARDATGWAGGNYRISAERLRSGVEM